MESIKFTVLDRMHHYSYITCEECTMNTEKLIAFDRSKKQSVKAQWEHLKLLTIVVSTVQSLYAVFAPLLKCM